MLFLMIRLVLFRGIFVGLCGFVLFGRILLLVLSIWWARRFFIKEVIF